MANDVQDTDIGGFRDRKAGLVAFGIIELLFGAFWLLMVAAMAVGMSAAASLPAGPAVPANARMLSPALLSYVLLAVWFIWMGIGSIQARRWARALLLVTSWFWLISGTMGLVFMLLVLPGMYDQIGKSGQMPHQFAAVFKCVMIGFMVVFYVIIPGVSVLFYGSRHVKATCERRDPRVRWTDKCPLPVLAVSLIAGFAAVCMPMMGAYGWAVPFFGTILTGVTGAAAVLGVMVLLGYVAREFYTLNIRAWWCAVMMVVAGGVSSAVTFSRMSLMDFYGKMNLPSQQLEMMKQFQPSFESLMVPMCGLWVVAALVYLFYIRKFLSRQEGNKMASGAMHVAEPVQSPPVPTLPQAGAPSGGLAIASLVLGVLAVGLGIFVIGGILGIIGLILGVVHLARRRSHRLLAGWGVGLSVVGALLSTAVLILCFRFFESRPHLTPQQHYAQSARELSDPTTPERTRFYALNGAAKEAFNLGKKEEARAYVEEQSRMLERYKGDWNYGNAVQDINLVLGRIAVSEGELDKAKAYLLKAGDSPGSPQMNSFGPNMCLAKDLLEKGERQVVLQYLKKCAVFWKMDHGQLDAWARQVESGHIPDFGANLIY